ncbi:MAG: isopentenyl phosphate kinase [Anaerolineaceae bacterium]|nr:isopentenyl phosphate kinase [Anaerolineaceae bacterium]
MLLFLKLGGSLITQKNQPYTARRETIRRLAHEIAAARTAQPHLQLLIGHGSGSYGHTAAYKHGTRSGVQNAEGWQGFVEVWRQARALNQIMVEALLEAGLPVIAFPPSASVVTDGGSVLRWELEPLTAALGAGLTPLVQGDTVFDRQRGGTILSTEELFEYLSSRLKPQRVLIAGQEQGVWADYPRCQRLLETLTPSDMTSASGTVFASSVVDVTGGMAEKVACMLRLVTQNPALEALIFSGEEPGTVQHVLMGGCSGTRIHA